MDRRIKELNKEQRIALARIVYDLIMADKIIDDEEVKMFAELFGEEDKRELFRKAQELSFSKAIKLLGLPYSDGELTEAVKRAYSKQRRKEAETALGVLTDTANSDGFCAPSEAILLLAIDYYLNKNNSSYSQYDIQSFKLTDVFIGKRFVLYVDNNESSVDLEISQNYELITNLLASIGFQFIYIPKIVKQYKSKKLAMFKTMSMYLFPDISDEKVEEIYYNLINMDTKTFVKKYLNDKLGFDISYSKPSFMVMLGRSSVIGKNISDLGLVYETYANFLKIDIGKNPVIDIINHFVIDFNRFVTFNFHIDFNPAKDKLRYHGFYKAFFRLVALAKDNPKRYNINISTSLSCVFINDLKLQLAPGKAAVYVLALCRSLFGDMKGIPNGNTYKKFPLDEQMKLQRQYEWICYHMGSRDQNERKPIYTNIKVRISEVRKEISNIVGSKLIGEIQLGTGDYIKTLVPVECVTVNNVPIANCRDWSGFI